MNQAYEKLLAATESIGSSHSVKSPASNLSIPIPLHEFYGSHNGVYIFDRALLIRPFNSINGVYGLLEWNDPSLWKVAYQRDLKDFVFFAEDVVGFSFCLGPDHQVYMFDPEVGELHEWAISLESWASRILDDVSEVGAQLAVSWNAEHGKIPFGYRIPPITPFVVAESEGVGNVLAPELILAEYRARLATRILDYADGEQVVFQSLVEFTKDRS